MSDYQHNMNDEKRPPALLPEGFRLVEITAMEASKSKGGNNMFVATITDVKTKKAMTAYLVAEPKKRWLLKSLLTACGIPAGQDGVYGWSITDVLKKKVIAVVEHEKQPWVNREGESVMQDKNKITEFLEAATDATGEAVAWEE